MSVPASARCALRQHVTQMAEAVIAAVDGARLSRPVARFTPVGNLKG